MRKIASLFAAALLAICPSLALAQSSGNGLSFLPLGYCQLTALSATTAAALTTCAGGIPAGTTRAQITIETQAVRYRDDGSAPTSTVGMPLAIAQTITYSGSVLKLQLISQTAGATVNVLFYR